MSASKPRRAVIVRFFSRISSWIMIGAALVAASYVALWAKQRVLENYTIIYGRCPGGRPEIDESVSLDVGLTFVPPVSSCMHEGERLYVYWLSASPFLFFGGAICLTVSLIIWLVRVWKFFR